jgi:hypothetical protein
MSVVWSAVCALAALAAAVQQGSPEPQPQTRTKVLPGHGYIRYEVLPGDEEAEPGELIVVHEERRPAPPKEAAAEEPAPAAPKARDQQFCAGTRAKLLARLFEMRGMQVEPELAEWLDRNLSMGNSDAKTIQLLGPDPLLLTAVKTDGIARGLAEDLARCERAHKS